MSFEPNPNTDIVGWVEFHLPRAIAWAEEESARTREVRRHNLQAAVDRGACILGHALGEGPYLYDRTRKCGYCYSAVKFRDTGEI